MQEQWNVLWHYVEVEWKKLEQLGDGLNIRFEASQDFFYTIPQLISNLIRLNFPFHSTLKKIVQRCDESFHYTER